MWPHAANAPLRHWPPRPFTLVGTLRRHYSLVAIKGPQRSPGAHLGRMTHNLSSPPPTFFPLLSPCEDRKTTLGPKNRLFRASDRNVGTLHQSGAIPALAGVISRRVRSCAREGVCHSLPLAVGVCSRNKSQRRN